MQQKAVTAAKAATAVGFFPSKRPKTEACQNFRLTSVLVSNQTELYAQVGSCRIAVGTMRHARLLFVLVDAFGALCRLVVSL